MIPEVTGTTVTLRCPCGNTVFVDADSDGTHGTVCEHCRTRIEATVSVIAEAWGGVAL